MSPADPLRNLGVVMTPKGPELRVWSESATAMELCLFAADDPASIEFTKPMTVDAHGVWTARTRRLAPGRQYSIRATGPTDPQHRFNPHRHLLDPYAKAIVPSPEGGWRSQVVDTAFDWEGVTRPRVAPDRRVIYEAHLKGLSKLNEVLPEHLRGTYAGLAHDETIRYLKDLGVTSVELLPVHAFTSEDRLLRQGMVNYWGYNTLGFFAPHAPYATERAQQVGPDEVLREFKGMVKALHRAGLEVILDVVYNHTAEEGVLGPTSSLRGIDNANYYRQTDAGDYIDVTGVGNTVNTATPAAQRLVLDSLRYWATECRVDGFRFDLAATLGRDEKVEFDRAHPLINAVVTDPELRDLALIAEPWDVGLGGWQTGNFPNGWAEWNDRYRDRMRDFWLTDISRARHTGDAGSGIGRFATRFAGSSMTFSRERGPLASVNFITAHDGFTLRDLVSYNVKHNLLNGENNRDGSTNNNSYNHGWEGPSSDEGIERVRRKAMRNLLGTLLLSSGVPMLTAGDEFGRSQGGNNNAYVQDSPVAWVNWTEREPWQNELWLTTQRLLRLRREHPALRPIHYGRAGEVVRSASQMQWFDALGGSMSEEEWNNPANRTLQYLAESTPHEETVDRILLIVHALEDDTLVRLPHHDGYEGYQLLWDSAEESPRDIDGHLEEHLPGQMLQMAGTSMRLYRARV